MDTADWVLCTTSAARVKLPVSAMAMKVRNWSISMSAVMGRAPRRSLEYIIRFHWMHHKHSFHLSILQVHIPTIEQIGWAFRVVTGGAGRQECLLPEPILEVCRERDDKHFDARPAALAAGCGHTGQRAARPRAPGPDLPQSPRRDRADRARRPHAGRHGPDPRRCARRLCRAAVARPDQSAARPRVG